MDLTSGQAINASSRPAALVLEAAREFVRVQLSKKSIRRVAAEAGLGRGLLQNFVDGGTPHPQNAHALVEYHQRSASQRDAVDMLGVSDRELREFFSGEYRRVRSLRRVARAVGVTPAAMEGFLDGVKATQPRVRHKLAAYYLARESRLTEPKSWPSSSARPADERAAPIAKLADEAAARVPDFAGASRPTPCVLEAAREFVRDQVSKKSIRRVAEEAGISRGIIEKFANGATPHPPNAHALVEYHQRSASPGLAEAGDTRGVSDEKLREFYSEEYRRVRSLRRVARAAGVTYGALEGFLDGVKATQSQVRHKLAAHYLARDGRLSEPKARRSSSAPRQPSAAGGARDSGGPPSQAVLDETREFIRERVKVSSVPRVAKDIGPPVTTKVVDNFLAGSVPRPVNTEALLAFHRRGGLPHIDSTHESNDTDDEMKAVRELVRSRDQREPLRIIAEETGIPRNTLQKFMRGSAPRPETREKLLRWYNALPPEGRVVLPTPNRPPEDAEEPGVELVRQLVARRQEHIGMYLLADELGVTTTPIRDFIAGSTPTTRTWEKFVAWYRVRQAAGLAVLHPQLTKEIRFQPPADTPSRAALGILMDAFPERQRRAVRQRVLEVMAAEHQNAGRDLPDWIKDLLKEPDPPRWYGTRTGLASQPLQVASIVISP